jgi:hypothetical protein
MPLSRFWRIAKISAEAICLAGRAIRRFKLHKRRQLFIRSHHETRSSNNELFDQMERESIAQGNNKCSPWD